MFKKWGQNSEIKTEKPEEISKNISEKPIIHEKNTILKGSKLIGDINVTCDLELSGEIEGNITSEQNSNIVIRGNCKGNISTREGNVVIDGELNSGDIIAGNNVKISGRFNGGEVKAKGKIHINGEFQGRLEADEIEIGPGASGNGELLYRECISIAKGAKIEGRISRIQEELKLVKSPPKSNTADINPAAGKISEAR
ncbi:polymer-forming cytoskeletal [bacterium BMS3Abin09]|nr:polymer-forming cytoskeletal [bacterium BMS3Abin09]GBE40737.1 polymer-forming cytoskeletal [bacterium BMS3Bbin09]HDH34068.1 polymer-forming cytoskeletal protein [Nitrospirota bacterium]HDO66993.1 polymer-forming cytoskeletal protein [Nitrospirota bacterium]HEW81167.1 polymer-forming cytoskeletal protein [Nitrospirota bacterium]